MVHAEYPYGSKNVPINLSPIRKSFVPLFFFSNLTNLSSGKFNVGVSATVKVTLKNGAFREDVGYGCVDGMRLLIAFSL